MISVSRFCIELKTVLYSLDSPLPICLIRIKHFGKYIFILILLFMAYFWNCFCGREHPW